MVIPKIPAFFNMKFTDKEGNLAPDGHLYNDQLNQSLNASLVAQNSTVSTAVKAGDVTIRGINPPSYTTTQINDIVADTNPKTKVPIGTIWYDSTDKKLKFLSDAGIVETITSS